MKKSILVLMVFLCASQALAVGLSGPGASNVIFEPESSYSVKYVIQSKSSEESEVLVTADSDAPLKFEKKSETLLLNPGERRDYVLRFETPALLPSGKYLVKFKVSEIDTAGGMSAMAAVGDTFFLINPYDKGYPGGSMIFRERYVPGEGMSFVLVTQNLGRVPIENFYAEIFLLESGREVMKLLTTPSTLLESFAERKINVNVPLEELEQGRYAIKAVLHGDEVQVPVVREFSYGSPEIVMLSTPVIAAGEETELVFELENKWNTDITDAVFRVAVHGLFDASKKLTLSPGKNVVRLESNVQPHKGGIVKGQLLIDSENYDLTNDVVFNVTGSSIIGAFFFGEPEAQNVEGPKGLTIKGMVVLMLLTVLIVGVLAYFIGRRSRGGKFERKH